jgi:hypothetical protein
MTNLSIEDFDLSDAVKIFPNPVKDILNIETDLDITLQLFNVLGKQLNELHFIPGQSNLDLSAYESGLYLIKVYITGDNSRTSKTYRIIKR